ncbi:unannotated protein [freshwater metagenome]|uniref:Unannotated protein n=1 Tax=freshwater metagenome TaxID=449393 RepID=A0A6J6D1S8_9ZZZZ
MSEVSGETCFEASYSASHRRYRGSIPSRPGPSPTSGMGSATSHQGIDLNRVSVANKLTKCVVPERGKPTTITGGSSSVSRDSGCRRIKSSSRSRAASSPTSRRRTRKRPRPDRPVSDSTEATWAARRSISEGSPKSSRPVRRFAAATSLLGIRSTSIEVARSNICCCSVSRIGTRRSSIRISVIVPLSIIRNCFS